MSFDLTQEPWIRVRFLDGAVDDVSLTDVFARAGEIRSLAGELPTQDAAVLRVLLAILLGAVRPPRPRKHKEAREQWMQWWNAQTFGPEAEAYLNDRRDRFDLLHPMNPFFQVAGLTTAKGNGSGLAKLIADVPDGNPYFTTRSGTALSSLTLAEAARWLIHCQAFDPSGIKTGAADDPRVKGGKGYPFGYPGWSGNLGLVILEGVTLFETLMLNLPLRISGPTDLPVWERAPLGPGVEKGSHVDGDGLRLPEGPADLFTWPSRRLRLFVDGDRVVDVQISNGDKRGPQNLRACEPMSAWRVSKNQSKGGNTVFMPVMHDPQRRVWQGLGALVPDQTREPQHHRPESLDFVSDLILAGALPAHFGTSLHIVGLEYGPQNSTIAGAIDDRLAASVAALTDPVLIQTAVDAASDAYTATIALANLASDLDKACGGDGQGRVRDDTREAGLARLDAPFRAWVRTLTAETGSNGSARATWDRIARGVLNRAAEDLVAQAGPAALVGRLVKQFGSDDLRWLDVGVAMGRFQHKLATTLPANPQER